MHILGQKEATWNTIFSIFERRRGPPNVAGPGKTFPPFPPLDGPARRLHGTLYIFTRDSIARICHGNSVHPSVTRVLCIKAAEDILEILSLSDRPVTSSGT